MSRMIEVTPELAALMADLKGALGKHPSLSAAEMLATVSQLAGNLAALQDQTRYSPALVMEIVSTNFMIGNQAAIEGLLSTTDGHS